MTTNNIDKKATILFTEDQQGMWKPLGDGLEARNYQVIWAYSVSEALQVIRKEEYKIDLLIVDLLLPLYNPGDISLFDKNIDIDKRRRGLLLIEKIKEESPQEIPVIVLTHVTNSGIMNDTDRIANYVFIKPPKLAELYSAVDRLLTSKKIKRFMDKKD